MLYDLDKRSWCQTMSNISEKTFHIKYYVLIQKNMLDFVDSYNSLNLTYLIK